MAFHHTSILIGIGAAFGRGQSCLGYEISGPAVFCALGYAYVVPCGVAFHNSQPSRGWQVCVFFFLNVPGVDFLVAPKTLTKTDRHRFRKVGACDRRKKSVLTPGNDWVVVMM